MPRRRFRVGLAPLPGKTPEENVFRDHAHEDLARVVRGRAGTVESRDSDPPDPHDGQVWVRGDLKEVRVRVGGATKKFTIA